MAARFEKDSRRTKNPGTRLYTPTRDSAAYAYDPETGERTEGIPAQGDGRTRPVPIRVQREMNTLERIGIMFCAFVFAGMIIFILSGYERISRAYADINTLNDEIEDVNLHISELNVAIECAVTIQQAEAAALAAGMTYPTQAQSLQIGDPLPAIGTGTAGTPSGSDPTTAAGTPTGEDPAVTNGDGDGDGASPEGGE